MKKNNKSRRQTRGAAVQAIYQWQMTQDQTDDILVQFVTGRPMDKVDKAYFSELVRGTLGLVKILDELIQPALDRPLAEVTQVEAAILRLAVYELHSRLDVPYKVVINEALELTKLFGTEEGFKFVNGVLDKIAPQLRQAETQE